MLRFLVFPLVFIYTCVPIISQNSLEEYLLVRHHWTRKDGFVDWFVPNFYQDKRGIIWMGTNSGLYNFDGINFKLVSENASKEIKGIFEEKNGKIVILSRQDYAFSLDVLDPFTEKMQSFEEFTGQELPKKLKQGKSLELTFSTNEFIWIGIDGIVFRWSDKWEIYYEKENLNFKVWKPASNNKSWIIDFDEENIDLQTSNGEILDSLSVKSYQLRFSFSDSSGNLWLGYSIPNTNAIDHYLKIFNQNDKIGFKKIYSKKLPVIPIEFGKSFWIRDLLFQKNLSLLNEIPVIKKAFEEYPVVKEMGSFLLDKNGGFWANNPEGLFRFELRKKLPFHLILNNENPLNSMRGLWKFKNSLFALSYQGAKILDLHSGQIQDLQFPGYKMGNTILKVDSKLIIGGYREPLCIFDLENKNFQVISNPKPFEFNCFEIINGDEIWAGTQLGVYKIDLKTNQIIPTELKNEEVMDIHSSKSGIFLATSNGFLKVNSEGKILETYFQNKDRFLSIHEDEEGIFWLGTKNSGLIEWNPNTLKHVYYDKKYGFPNNTIHAVLEDSKKNLWLPTNFGLIRFNKISKEFNSYFESDGLANNEFNTHAYHLSEDGEIFLGGINGITWFNPLHFEIEEQELPPLQLVQTKISSFKNGTYQTDFVDEGQDKPIILNSFKALVDLTISPMIFNEFKNYNFFWKIKEIQKDWVVQNTSTIRLSQLPFGNYTLLIKYSKIGDSQESDILEIPIHLIRPLFLKWPFIILYVFMIIGIGISIAYFRNKSLIQSNRILESEIKKRTLLLEKRTKDAENDRETIRLQSEELKMMDELKSNFFSNITHELRTPITLILGPLEKLISSKKDFDGSLKVVHRNALRLLNLVEELLDISKLDTKKIMLIEKPLNLYNFINSCINFFKPFTDQKGIELTIDFELNREFVILADEKKLEKIITNLISNAIKHTPSNGIIKITVLRKGPQLKISVKDSGKGILPQDLPFVFERYFQSKETEKLQGGTGIGLALSSEYIKAMGGSISVESEYGEGATFTISLPTNENFDFPAIPVPDFSAKKSPTNHTILLVDDQLDILWYIKNLLEKEYSILTALNGKEALPIIENHKIDLAIIDIMMPIMDGFELLKIIRSKNFDFPAIFLTALTDLPSQSNALRLGVDDYLTKPFQESELKTRITNLIARYRSRKLIRLDPEFSFEMSLKNNDPLISYNQVWMSKVEESILKNLKNPNFTIQMLSEELNISKRNLYYKIEAYTGMTPNQYLTEIRLLEARKLLENKVYETVAEVCFAVGFTTTRYFSKLIKERFGKFPADYKN